MQHTLDVNKQAAVVVQNIIWMTKHSIKINKYICKEIQVLNS